MYRSNSQIFANAGWDVLPLCVWRWISQHSEKTQATIFYDFLIKSLTKIAESTTEIAMFAAIIKSTTDSDPVIFIACAMVKNTVFGIKTAIPFEMATEQPINSKPSKIILIISKPSPSHKPSGYFLEFLRLGHHSKTCRTNNIEQHSGTEKFWREG